MDFLSVLTCYFPLHGEDFSLLNSFWHSALSDFLKNYANHIQIQGCYLWSFSSSLLQYDVESHSSPAPFKCWGGETDHYEVFGMV